MSRLPIDRLFLGYVTLTGGMALVLGGPSGAILAFVHAAVFLFVWRTARWQPRAGVTGFLRGSYPVLIAPVLYAELATLNRFATEGYFDAMVIAWEEAIFGVQPSIALAETYAWLPLSEFLHLGYFAYYAIVPAALIGVFRTRGFEALQRTAFAVASAFFFSYAIFIVFPVAGPRYEFPRIGGRPGDGTFYGLVHAVLEGGSSKGTAFPSSHIAASVAAVVAAGREDARWLWLLLIPEVALAVGTVYGRFHYAVDAVAGLFLGLAVCAATPPVFRRLEGRQPEPAGEYPTK